MGECPENVNELVLEKVRFAVSNTMSKSMIRDMKISQQEWVSRGLVGITLEFFVPGSLKTVEKDWITYPASLWDYLKWKIGLRHRTERHPVVVNHYHICPHLDYPAPEDYYPTRNDCLAWLKNVELRG